MSWQSDFDATGPKWEGSAEAKAEEKQLRKMMDDVKARIANQGKSTIDPSVFEELDRKMVKLKQREKDLMQLLETASAEEEVAEITTHLATIRSLFQELLEDYRRLKRTAV